MWNRISGKSSVSKDESPLQSTRRNDHEQRQSARHSGSIASANSNKKASSQAEDRDLRGFNPTSTSYSTTTREKYPGVASASIASSYATASANSNGESYVAPGLVRNASLADQMPRSSSSRSSRGQNGARETRDKERDETAKSDSRDQDVERRHKRDKRDKKDNSLRKSENGFDDEAGTSRGPDDFPDQVASSGFSQFPGQYDGAVPISNGLSTEHPAMSSHVQDQFPGQFPTQSSAPYRPPLAASEGGPGLAAEYYGDDGQSVAEQPGNRANTPSLIIGAEPHLQPALAVAAPPPEPSASGGVGAAASFFSGEFEEDEAVSTHGQHSSSTYVTGQVRPNSSYHSSSAPVIPTMGVAAIGSTASHFIDNQASSHQHRPDHESPTGVPSSENSTIMCHRPPSQTQDTTYSSTSRPPKPGKQSSQSSNTPIYAAGLVGAAGLAAAAYENNHHSSNQNLPSTPHYSTTSMAQRHRNHGPFAALVDFFKDPEGVAQFEEYSQIIGVCRHCFAPGSSPRDAPRKHFSGRRRSNERYGSSTRVDKDSRYYSSENEGRRKNKSWLASGLAGYGLAKVGGSLLKEKDDFGDTYSRETRRFSPDGRDRRARHRSRSKERIGNGITGAGKSDRKESRDNVSNDTKRTTYSTRRHSRTRSRSIDRKNGLTEAAIGAALGTSMVASSSQRQSHSPQGSHVKSKHTTRTSSSERRRKTNKKNKNKKRDKGFFSFGNGSSSSSSTDLAYGGSQDKYRSKRGSPAKSREDKKAEAALLGLGAAAAALALNDGRQSHRKKAVKQNVGMRETKDHHRHNYTQANRSKESSGNLDDELWESAAEDDYQSVNSDLAYGAPSRRDSRASLSSESSGTNKWGWRWGSNKNRRTSSPRRKSSNRNSISAIAGTAGPGVTSAAITSPNQQKENAMDSTSSLPLQHVYPVPTSDPSRFDVDREGSIASSNRPVLSSRPEAVPIQHPRPRAPVSAAIYSSQTAYDHSYSAPTGPAVFSQNPYHHSAGIYDARSNTHEASIPDAYPRFKQQADDMASDFKIRRRDTSPARIGEDSISSSMTPRRRTSATDESGVRFDLTEEQEERDRRERRRKRKQDKERREAEEQERIERERRASKEYPSNKTVSKTKPEEDYEGSSDKAWIGPAAAGVIGAAIGIAAAKDKSNSEETREERRERRRRERELEDEEETLSRNQRRRKQREREKQDAAIKERKPLPDEISASSMDVDHQGHPPEKQDMSIWQEAASTKRSSSHEDYGAFFTPLELLNKSNDQVKVTSANADADVDLEQVPQIVTVEPKRIHDLSKSPAFSLADTDDQVDSSKLSFPWLVPKLRLVEPTPPSTRGSTPIPQPRDASAEDFKEPQKEPLPSKVKWADDQTHEYTIIAPKEDHSESIEPPSEELSGTGSVTLPRSTHERDMPDDETHAHIDSVLESSSASYGEDTEFAATLAASAEDAGFDPSIVISNPVYRRRDSPPGSNERSMPGGFNDEDEPPLNKKERKRKEKASRRRNQNDGPNQRDDDAVVQDIISQVEESESQRPSQNPSEFNDNEWESTKNSTSKKSKKRRKGSEPQVDLVETSESATKPLGSESGDVYESPTVDLRATTSSAPTRDEAESSSKSHNKPPWDSASFDDAASAVTSQITTEASKDFKPKSKDRGKGSIWDRVLGKSNGSLPREDGSEDVIEEVTTTDFHEPKKSKRSKERKPTQKGSDGHDGKERNSIAATTAQVSGRISQDLPAKDEGTSLPSAISAAGSVAQYLDHGTDLEQSEIVPESFLGMRPEPPPPPDTRMESEKFYNSLKTTSLPNSPRSESNAQSRRFSDAEISNQIQTPAALPSSPTAVPFHFRQPYRSSSTARSLSQTPLSSNRSVADPPPKQKIRPRSTEFKSSKEIRPLWLVERHRSHQEPTPDETYPSLPSSHTTSRSSSVHNLEGNERRQNGDYEIKEPEHEPTEVELGPMKSTNSHPIQSDLLDSQQATPAASSFPESGTGLGFPSLPATGDSSPKVFAEGNSQQSSSMLENPVLGAVLGGSAALALNAAIQKNDPSPPDLSQEENVGFERGLDDTAIDTGTHQSDNEMFHQEEDFIPQKRMKGKKKKRNASQFRPNQIPVAEVVEDEPSMNLLYPEPLSPESMRQLQEQDAQDAVDTWSQSALPSEKIKKGKKGKRKALLERLPEKSGQYPTAQEIPKDNIEAALPKIVQESDTLTPEMSREQTVRIMAIAAQDAKDQDKASQFPTPVFQGNSEVAQDDLPQDDFPQSDVLHEIPHETPHEVPYEAPHEVRLEVQPQDDFQDGNLPRDTFSRSPSNLPQDENLRCDLLQDSSSALPSPVPTKVTFIDPFLEQGHENVLQSPKAPSVSQTAIGRDDLTQAMSPPLELSPRATPLPDDDDEHDLLEERPETPADKALTHSDVKKMASAADEFSDVLLIHESSAMTPGTLRQSQDLAAQTEQFDANDYFGALSKNDSKYGTTANEDFPVEDSGSTEIQEKNRQLPIVVTSTTLKDDRPKDSNDEMAMDVSKKNHETAGDAFGGFTSKRKGRKGKKAKQSFSVENSKTVESQEEQESFLEIAASEAPKDQEVKSLIDESASDVPQSKTESLEDEWTGFTSKKEGRKGKKGKPNFSIEDSKAIEIEEENELRSNTTTSKASESYRARDMIDEKVTHVPKTELIGGEPKELVHIPTNQTPKPEVVEDKRADSDNKSTGGEIERQDSRTQDLGHGSDETGHQLERRVEGRGEMNDRPSSLATTGTYQEVTDMLRLGETEDSVEGELKEAFPAVSGAEDKLQKSSEDQIYEKENRNLPVAYESAFLQFEKASEKPQEGERSPTVDTSVANTDAARVVQNILAVEGKPTSSVDAEREAIVASTSVEGTAADILLNDDGLNWDAQKRKKKGKKGNKNANSLRDEPEAIESAEVLDRPGGMNTSLIEEPAETNEVGWEAPQKKKRKGKKGKKSEVFSLDEPDVMGPVKLSGSSAAVEIPQLEEELSVKAIDEVSPRQFTTDEKGRRSILSRTDSDFRDENEPNDVPTETPLQGLYNAKNLPAIASSLRDDFQPDLVSSEPSQETGLVEDRLAVATETREEVRPNVFGLPEAPRDDDKIEDRPQGGMPPVPTENGAPGDVAEPAVPTELPRDNEIEEYREALLEQEEDFRPPKSKRDKKKSKKSKKTNTLSLDDDETLTTGDGQISATKNSEKDQPEQMIPSELDAFKTSEKTAQQSQIEGEDPMPFKNKKDKKKSKRSKKLDTFPLDKEVSPTLEYEPVSNHEDVEKDAREQTLPANFDVVEEPETFVGGPQEKDLGGTKEAQPFDRQTDGLMAQSEQEYTPQLNEGSEIDSKTDPPNALVDLVMEESKRGEPVHGFFDPVSAHAAAFIKPHKASSSVTPPPLEQLADASEAIAANQQNELRENFGPEFKTNTDPLPSFTQIQKDQERPQKARPLIWEGDEASQEPRAVFEEYTERDDPAQRSDIHDSSGSKFRSRPGRDAQEIESTDIVQPGVRSEEQGVQESLMEEQPSRARADVLAVVEAEPDESFENIREGQKDKMTNNEQLPVLGPQEDWLLADGRGPASVTATRSEQGNEQTSEQQPRDDSTPAEELLSHQGSTAGVKSKQSPILTELGAMDDAKDKEAFLNLPVREVETPEKQHDEVQRDGSGVEEISSLVVPELTPESGDTTRNTEPVRNVEPLGGLDKDKLIPAVEVELSDAQEQHEYNKEYARELERAVPDTKSVADLEALRSPDIDKPIPAVEIEMLDAQEQREYNEEYAKELERQLSPLQEGERGDPSRDEAFTPKFSQPSMTPVMERPYEDEHRPLARPPALEDIIEESGSRSGSVQGSPVGREDILQPTKSTKKSKKGKKGKKGKKQQPVIWEDETATPPQEPAADHGVEPFITSLEGPGVGENDIDQRLDSESIEQRSLEERISASPIGGSNDADKGYVINNDPSSDYFAIQPNRPAETDVGTEDTREFRQALSMEPPYSTSNRSPAWETQTAQAISPRDDAVNTDNQDEKFDSVVTDSHEDSMTKAEPAEEHVNDDFETAPIQSTKNEGKKPGAKASAREPNPQALGRGDLMDRPTKIETQVTDSLEEKSPSRLHSSQTPLHEEDERLSVADTSHSRSGSMGGVVAGIGLGVSALAAEKFTRRDSDKEDGHSKKAKEDCKGTDFESGIGDSESPLGRKELLVKEQEHRQTPKSANAVSEWQHQQATPPQSPPSANYEAVANYPVVGDLGQSSETHENRDSAIYVSGSPMMPEMIPYHRAARDSGYPDSEASPVNNDELESPGDPTVVSGVAASESIGRVRSRAHESERQSSTSRSPFDVLVEASSEYDVSVSRPKERRKRSLRRSGADYDSDDSADSGFDIQRRRRRQAMAEEPREPSPVSSTTKDRSSALFDSSPSATGETVVNVQGQDASPYYDPVREEPTWSFDHEAPPQQRSRVVSRERESDSTPEHAPESIGYESPGGQHEDAGLSLFGGPQSLENDSQSLARSPRLNETRGRQRLNTISENSADGSPGYKKDKRTMSDVGSPESGVKGRRMRSPSVGEDIIGEHVSTYDAVSRPSWPAADEEKHAVEERSRSRNSEHSTAFSSRQSALPDVTSRHKEGEYRTGSAASMQSEKSIHAIIRTPDQFRSASGLSYSSSGTPPLRRVDRSASGDLRGASRKSQDQAKNHTKSSSEFEAEPELGVGIPSSSTYDPVTDKGKSRADMADVYEGWGDVRGQSPMSPTRPPSMRKRQSMQLLDLETRLDQMVSENRLLASQKLTAEKALQEQARDYSQERRAYEEAMQEHKMYLKQKDSELSELKQIIEQLNDQAAHLTEVNEGLASSRGLDEEHQQRYSQLQAEHASTHEQWQQSTRELESLKEQHTQLSSGMEDIVRHEVNVALEEKNLELRQMQNELENAKQQVRDLQQQLLASRNSDDFVEQDEDYFDSQCQSLCQHVQQWVLRFSKFSDMKACYLCSEIRDEKVVDRMENAILDGSDVDDYLSDRVKRRDVFMSVVMTMIWEFIFTRYLFGMDREQRQKLKNLEKTLQEVGPMSAVHKWRATTLTLLMKREAFENQRATDTEAVVHEIYDTLATFLPPPSHLVGQIQDSLRKVIDTAVDLSIEMRTQRAEYSMPPPLQPEYDTNGDLARKVYFSALTMNERSGATSSNEALQEQHAVVKMVLFPLVVKNEDDDEQIVVCPAQVLTAEGSKGKKTVRVMSAQGGSEASFSRSDVRMEGGMI